MLCFCLPDGLDTGRFFFRSEREPLKMRNFSNRVGEICNYRSVSASSHALSQLAGIAGEGPHTDDDRQLQ